MSRVILISVLALSAAACASGRYVDAPHPYGYGHRDSPGRAYPTPLPVPGYSYRFRADPQGLGRIIPPPQYGYLPAEPLYPVSQPVYGYEQDYAMISGGSSGHVVGGETYSVVEGYSEDVYVEGGVIVEPAPYAGPEAFY